MELRAKWVCPNCAELSPTRHWSVGRHIIRKHAGVGEPVSINTHQTRSQMNTGSGWSNFSVTTSTTQFNLKTNSLHRHSNGHDYRNDYFNSDNYVGTHNQTYPTNNTTFSAAAKDFTNE